MGRSTAKRTPARLELQQVAEQDFRLRVPQRAGADRVYEVAPGTTLLGSAAKCQIKLDDESVSRAHCEIERSEGTLRIRDLGSTNGTFVDGVAVDSAYLRPGSRIRVGSVGISLEVAYMPVRGSSEKAQHYGFRGLVGKTPAMVKLFGSRDRLAQSDVTVLIEGETGTGKSALARSIHAASERRAEPFIVFDCSSVAPTLVESALFGHVKGAFTGADATRVGALESAGRGTLFIDEVAELSPDLQPKLLRALEEREFTAVGSATPSKVTCRVVAACQGDLRAASESGRFRRDLYYRLAVVVVPLPPLRDRKDDIPLIVDQLLFGMDQSITPFKDMPEALRSAIMAHSWPGNIRELRNYLERLTLDGFTADAPPPGAAAAPLTGETDAFWARSLAMGFHAGKESLVIEFEQRFLKQLLDQTGYNVKEAARVSGLNRRHLHDMLVRHGLDKKTLLAGKTST